MFWGLVIGAPQDRVSMMIPQMNDSPEPSLIRLLEVALGFKIRIKIRQSFGLLRQDHLRQRSADPDLPAAGRAWLGRCRLWAMVSSCRGSHRVHVGLCRMTEGHQSRTFLQRQAFWKMSLSECLCSTLARMDFGRSNPCPGSFPEILPISRRNRHDGCLKIVQNVPRSWRAGEGVVEQRRRPGGPAETPLRIHVGLNYTGVARIIIGLCRTYVRWLCRAHAARIFQKPLTEDFCKIGDPVEISRGR